MFEKMNMISRFTFIALFILISLSTNAFSLSKSECTGPNVWWNSPINECELIETKSCIETHGEGQHYNPNTGSCEPVPYYSDLKACQSQGEGYKYNPYGGDCEVPPSAVQQGKASDEAPSELCIRCKNVMLGGMASPDPEFLQQCKAAGCYGTGQGSCPEGYHLDKGICCEKNYKAAANGQACVYVGEAAPPAPRPAAQMPETNAWTDDELRTRIKDLTQRDPVTLTQKELSLLTVYLDEFTLRQSAAIAGPTDAEQQGFVLGDLEIAQRGLELVREKLRRLLLDTQGLNPADNKPVQISLMASLLPPEWFKQVSWYLGKTGQESGLLGLSQPVGATRQIGDAFHDLYSMLLNGLPNKPGASWKLTTSPFDPSFAPKVKPPYGRGFGSIAEAKAAVQKGTFDPRLSKMMPSEGPKIPHPEPGPIKAPVSPKVHKVIRTLQVADTALTGLQAASDMRDIDSDPDTPQRTKTATKTLIGGLAGAKIAANAFSATGAGAPIGFIIGTTADAASGVVVAAAKTAGILNNNWESQAGAPSKDDWNGLARNFVGKRMLDPDSGKWFAEEGDQVNFKTVPSKDGTLFVGNDGTGRVYRLTDAKTGWFSSTQKMQILNKEGHWVDAQTKDN